MFIRRQICFIIFVILDNVLGFVCPKKGICLCHSKYSGYNQTNCNEENYSIDIIIQPDKNLTITCFDWEWQYFNQTPMADNGINAINFYECDLPINGSLGDIARKLGAADAHTLLFESSESLYIKRKHLEGLKNVRHFRLGNNNIHKNELQMDTDVLANLVDLTTLMINDFDLDQFNLTEFFNHATKLELLELTKTNLQTIAPGTFDNLKDLYVLVMVDNRLTELQSDIFDKLTSLKALNLGWNNIIDLPENIFATLENLENLNLAENNFASLPVKLLRNNTKLKTFKLFRNNGNMTTFPNRFFSDLIQLVTLDLQKNQLVTLPQDLIWGSTSLKVLFLNKNNLKSLPAHIFRDSQKLVTLDLSSNYIEELPDNIFSYLHELKEIDLSKNHLSSISKYLFAELFNLEHLTISGNRLTTIPDESFRSLSKLRIAVLIGNSLKFKPSLSTPHINKHERLSPFLYCSKLEELYLQDNHISEIFSDWTSNSHLRVLSLRYNNISVISSKDLQFMSDNITVDLSDNNIQHISLPDLEQFFNHQKNPNKIIQIIIHGNRINCLDCEFYDFLRYIEGKTYPHYQKNFHIVATELMCHNPIMFDEHKYVMDLQSEKFTCLINGTHINVTCPEKCKCSLRPASKTYKFDCSYKNLTNVPSDIKILDEFSQVELNLFGNQLTKMPNLKELKLKSVTKLILASNLISEVFLDGLSKTIQVLKLHNNNISKISYNVLEFLKNSMNLKQLTLHKNPWICNCSTVNFLNFIKAMFNIMPRFNVTCRETNELMLNMTEFNFCPPDHTVLTICSIVITSTVVIFFGLIYRKYRQQIKMWLFKRNRIGGRDIRMPLLTTSDDEKIFDLFVTYALEDENFVVNKLKRQLESNPICLTSYFHQVDPEMDAATSVNDITDIVENCKQAILVVSPNFLKTWEEIEFRTTYSQALKDNQLKLIVILYGDVGPMDKLEQKLKEHIDVDSYIKWEDSSFSTKIKNALVPEILIDVESEVARFSSRLSLIPSYYSS